MLGSNEYYKSLLKLSGVKDPKDGLTMVPFLDSDRHYLLIPGRILRINNLDGKPSETERYQTRLPEIPLIPLDLKNGFPTDFGRVYGRADLFIVNHGVVLGACVGEKYLTTITHATRRGSILMYFEHQEPDDFSLQKVVKSIRAEQVTIPGASPNLPDWDSDGKLILLRKL